MVRYFLTFLIALLIIIDFSDEVVEAGPSGEGHDRVSYTVLSECTDNSECPDDEYCFKGAENCDGVGTCQWRPVFCNTESMPVCGCDGKTYGNFCFVAMAGVNMQYAGECHNGDVNGDCSVDAIDVMAVVRHILRIHILDINAAWRADCSGPLGNCAGDGKVDILDIVKIINLILGLDSCQ